MSNKKQFFSEKIYQEKGNEQQWRVISDEQLMHVHELQRPCAYTGVRSSDCKRVTPHDRDIISDLTTSRRAGPEQRNELNPACARTQTRHKHRRAGLGYQTIKTSKAF